MPLLALQTSAPISNDKREIILTALSTIVAQAIGKPEAYVMVTFHDASMVMAGTTEPAAFADVRSIGSLSQEVNTELSKQICALLQRELAIPGDRIYLNFTEIDRQNWGYDSKTFG